MKLKIAYKLRKALLIALLSVGLGLSQAHAVDITVSTGGTQNLTSDLGWAQGDNLIFEAGAAGARVEYGSNITNVGNITVAEGADGAVLVGTNNGEHYISGFAGETFDINDNFTIDLGTHYTGNGIYATNFALGTGTVNMDVATSKTFTIIADIVGDAGGQLNIAGGGTVSYQYAAGTASAQTGAHNYDLTISGGSTLDLTANSGAQNTYFTTSDITLNSGNIQVAGGGMSLSNDISFSGASSILGEAGETITLTGTLQTTGGSLDFGDANVDLSGATLDLSSITAGEYSSFFTTTGTLTGFSGGAVDFDVVGLSGRAEASWTVTGGTLGLTLTGGSAATLTWNAGATGTWSEGSSGSDWDTTATNKSFFASDHVIFNTASDTTVTIDGTVTAASITVGGDADLTFEGAGSLMGAGALSKTGNGALIVANSNADFTGNTTISEGTLELRAANAMGSGTVTLAGNTTLVAGHSDAFVGLNAQLQSGATLELTQPSYNSTYSGTLATGATLRVDANQTISAGGPIATGTTTHDNNLGYTGNEPGVVRASQGYTVSVGEGSHLTENVRLAMTGGTTVITGGGVYEVHSLILSYSSATATTLEIAADTTLRISNTTTNESGSTGALMLSNYGSNNNAINVYGTLDSAAGISDRDGGGAINVKDEGELILRQGLTTHDSRGNKQINLEAGSTLTLGNQSDTTDHGSTGAALNVEVNTGTTLKAFAAEGAVDSVVNVYTSLDWVAGSSVSFDANGQNLNMKQNVNLGQAEITGSVAFDGAQNTVDDKVTIHEDASLTTSQLSVDGVSIEGKDGGEFTLTGSASGGAIEGGSLTGLTIANANITGATISSSTISNSTLTGVTLASGVTLSNVELSDVLLTGVQVTQSTGTINTTEGGVFEDALIFTLDVNDLATGVSGQYTLDLTLDATQLAALNTALDNDDVFGIAIAGLDDLSTLVDSGDYVDVFFTVNGVSIEGLTAAQGLTIVDGGTDVMLYIPEPSTATLSLLALTGLLARRRRK